jgi:hypothetical protein
MKFMDTLGENVVWGAICREGLDLPSAGPFETQNVSDHVRDPLEMLRAKLCFGIHYRSGNVARDHLYCLIVSRRLRYSARFK